MDEILKERFLCCESWDRGKIRLPNTWGMYPFTTENIAGYIKDYDFRGKSLLTVGSSGDQVINAILYGCKDITLLDMVPDAIFYYYLKAAGLISLSKDEFLEFFRYTNYNGCYDNLRVFNYELYDKLRETLKVLNYEAFLYFDEFFSNFSGLTIRTILFKSDEDTTDTLERINPYLSSNIDYEEARKRVKKVSPEFISTNILDFKSERTYDNIWLSNIFDYLNSTKKRMKMAENAYNCLNDGGRLLLAYIFLTSKEFAEKEDFYKEISSVYSKTLIELTDCGSVYYREWDDSRRDSLLVLKK